MDLQLQPDEEDAEGDSSDSNSEEDNEKEDKEEFLIRERPAKKEKANLKKGDEEEDSKKLPGASPEIEVPSKQPTIEFKLALGNFDNNNPIMNMLGDNDEDDSEEKQQSISKEEKDNEEKTDDTKLSSLLQVASSGNNKRKRTGPIITELS